MKNIIFTLTLLGTFALMPFVASADPLRDLRNQVASELQGVNQEFSQERRDLIAAMRALPAGAEKNAYRAKIEIINGRLAFIRSVRRDARTSYSFRQLDILISVFDLNVSRA